MDSILAAINLRLSLSFYGLSFRNAPKNEPKYE